MAQIKAIDTEYKGYLFRSRLEARYAVFLDGIGEEWQYEIQGYELESGRYLPDFFLPRLNCWLEIKGVEPTLHERNLCCELANATGTPAAMACGLPGEHLSVYCVDCTDSTGGDGWWDECFWALDNQGELCICSNNDRYDRSFLTPDYGDMFHAMKLICDTNGVVDQRHYDAAKKARFEFQKR